MSKQVVFFGADPQTLRPQDRQKLEELGKSADYQVLISRDPALFDQAIERIVVAAGTVPRQRLSAATALQWYQQFGTGSEWLMANEQVRRSQLVITNTSDNHYNALAEHCIALVLALTRQVHHAVRAQSRREWFNPGRDTLPELRGKVLLLVGVGSIGRRLAAMAAPFDMEIVGLRRDPSKMEKHLSRCVAPEQLLAELPAADIVVNSLPLTPATTDFFAAAAFAAMQQSAIFINVGRGKTVDQEAMIDALQKKQFGAAGLDVFSEEPLPPDSPLWAMDNVILTGHYAGGSDTMQQRFVDLFIDNLSRYLRGEPLRNIVDKAHCY